MHTLSDYQDGDIIMDVCRSFYVTTKLQVMIFAQTNNPVAFLVYVAFSLSANCQIRLLRSAYILFCAKN